MGQNLQTAKRDKIRAGPCASQTGPSRYRTQRTTSKPTLLIQTKKVRVVLKNSFHPSMAFIFSGKHSDVLLWLIQNCTVYGPLLFFHPSLPLSPPSLSLHSLSLSLSLSLSNTLSHFLSLSLRSLSSLSHLSLFYLRSLSSLSSLNRIIIIG